jgi:hypothetical protein
MEGYLLLLISIHHQLAYAFFGGAPPITFSRYQQEQLRQGRAFVLIHSIPKISDNEDEFPDSLSELEALGGDPFFLQEDDVPPVVLSSSKGEQILEIEAMGGDPFFISDDDEEDDFNKEEEVEPDLSSESFITMMSMSTSGGGVMDMIGKGNKDSLSEPALSEPKKNEVRSFDEVTSDIESMGGDPFFISDEEDVAFKLDEKDDEPALTPESLMAMAYSASSGGRVMDLLGKANEDLISSSSEEGKTGETSSLDNRISEIESMGGDSFFLSDDSVSKHNPSKPEMSEIRPMDEGALDIESMGGDPFFLSDGEDDNCELGDEAKGKEEKEEAGWEWDGAVDEEAHLGF